jgi:hypothetical protein
MRPVFLLKTNTMRGMLAEITFQEAQNRRLPKPHTGGAGPYLKLFLLLAQPLVKSELFFPGLCLAAARQHVTDDENDDFDFCRFKLFHNLPPRSVSPDRPNNLDTLV